MLDLILSIFGDFHKVRTIISCFEKISWLDKISWSDMPCWVDESDQSYLAVSFDTYL